MFEGEKTNAGSKNTGKTFSAAHPDPGDSVLVSYGLSPELEVGTEHDDHEHDR